MAIEISAALNTIIGDNLAAAAALFASPGLAWHWEMDGDTGIRYVAEVVDATNALRMVIAVPWTSGPAHYYPDTEFSFEDETVVSSTQTRVNSVGMPPLTASQRMSMTTFTDVLNSAAAFTALLQAGA